MRLSGGVTMFVDVINSKSLFKTKRFFQKEGSVVVLKSLVRLLFTTLTITVKPGKIPLVSSFERPDLKKLALSYIESSNELNLCEPKYIFNIRLGCVFGHIKKCKSLSNDLNELFSLLWLLKSREKIDQALSEVKVIFLFNEALMIENFIAQLANYQQIHTIALQHGFYVEDKSPTFSRLNYTDLVSKQVFCWGKYSSKLFKKNNNNIDVAVIGRAVSHKYKLMPCDHKAKPTVYLIFDALDFSSENRKILELVSKAGREFLVKILPHPSLLNVRGEYNSMYYFGSSVCEHDVFIGNRSSLLLELASDGFFCCYVPGSPFESIDDDEWRADIPGVKKFTKDRANEYISNFAELSYLLDHTIRQYK